MDDEIFGIGVDGNRVIAADLEAPDGRHDGEGCAASVAPKEEAKPAKRKRKDPEEHWRGGREVGRPPHSQDASWVFALVSSI